jgi:hypothetical protein
VPSNSVHHAYDLKVTGSNLTLQPCNMPPAQRVGGVGMVRNAL